MPKSVYIHIPFCEQICHYCDFNKFYLKYQPVSDYLLSLEKEMESSFTRFPVKEIKTIFIGGGTPTALSKDQLEQLMNMIHKYIDIELVQEFSVEANPDNLTEEKLSVLKNYGVNRLSIGVQSFNEELLKKIGRTHTNEVVFHSIKLAQKMGFHNISIDLMYALPTQTLKEFKQTLEIAFSLDLAHYSSYSLLVEPKTVFYNLWRNGKLTLPPQEEEAVMYEYLMEQMEKRGFRQYEISNFSKPGFESKHNLTYWNNEEYFGFGAGAHSYVHGVRRVNAGVLKKYMSLIESTNFPYVDEHLVTKTEQMEEELFLGLRKTRGISIRHFANKFGISIDKVFGQQIEEQSRKGLLVKQDDHIFLTHKGKLLGNEVFQAFLSSIE
ncbi:radical SAM family heme chaperone HemW [Bacillus sp. FJAT-47783]|uniref:radical SAM family heme chaperone HemW n=1 Tax=Bacillus sp. FJAT-47783 TaxID=2922712 RepID=UPI001FAE38ED|nr:radical SAM family heme chaperone HemW [Bacillus sp. FJAT-47783]